MAFPIAVRPQPQAGEYMPDFDQRECQIGDPDDDTGDRIPRVMLEIARCHGEPDNPAHKLASLSITTAAIAVSLVGLAAADLRELIGFLAEYEQRLREF
jgi:hypothetical protein